MAKNALRAADPAEVLSVAEDISSVDAHSHAEESVSESPKTCAGSRCCYMLTRLLHKCWLILPGLNGAVGAAWAGCRLCLSYGWVGRPGSGYIAFCQPRA